MDQGINVEGKGDRLDESLELALNMMVDRACAEKSPDLGHSPDIQPGQRQHRVRLKAGSSPQLVCQAVRILPDAKAVKILAESLYIPDEKVQRIWVLAWVDAWGK